MFDEMFEITYIYKITSINYIIVSIDRIIPTKENGKYIDTVHSGSKPPIFCKKKRESTNGLFLQHYY